MADLAGIKSFDRVIEIVHPASGEPLGVTVTLGSIDDDEKTGRIKRSILDRRLHLEARGKHFKADEIEENKREIYFATMTGWDWHGVPDELDKNGKVVKAGEPATFNGEVPEFTKRKVMEVLIALPWFGDQISEAIGDTKAFFGKSK